MIPLSYAQQRLWFLNRLEGPNATFNAPLLLRLTGALDRAALCVAWRDVLQRHESLRTAFRESDGEPHQHILDADEPRLALTLVDCDAAELDSVLLDLQALPYDLTTDLPVRARLLSTGPEDHVLALLLHHIVSDGWSTAPLLRDLARAYAARSTDGSAPAWEPLPVQYADYTLWQRDLLGDLGDPESLGGRQLAYWRAALDGVPEELELPTDRPRPVVATHRGGRVAFALNPRRSSAHHPLFQVALAFGGGALQRVGMPSLSAETDQVPLPVAKFDLGLYLDEVTSPDGSPQGVEGELKYATDLFAPATAADLAARFTAVLRAASRAPDAPIVSLAAAAPVPDRAGAPD